MQRARRLIPVVAALLVVALVASPADAKKKKKKKPVAQQTIAGSVTIFAPGCEVLLGTCLHMDGFDSTYFEFDWTDPDNNSAKIEATWSPGPGVDPFGVTNNDIDIYLHPDAEGEPGDAMEPPGECGGEPSGSGCSAGNGSEFLSLPKLTKGHYWVEFHSFIMYTVNIEVDFTITFFNAAGKPGPAPK